MRYVRQWGVATLALTSSACGPWQSSAYLADAETMLAAAKTAQAEKRAPYEWTAATLYLHKAKEEVGYSDYEEAVDFAKKAVEFATRARDSAQKLARRAADGPQPPQPTPVK